MRTAWFFAADRAWEHRGCHADADAGSVHASGQRAARERRAVFRSAAPVADGRSDGSAHARAEAADTGAHSGPDGRAAHRILRVHDLHRLQPDQ